MSSARHTLLLTSMSLVAFASNSILCRLALAGHQIDAASFTALRLVSGALVLGALAFRDLRGGAWPGSVASAAALLLYAVPFSFAYLRLQTGVGALILFGSVQVTMIGWGLVRGERASAAVWAGLALAFAGLVGLAKPGNGAPDALGIGAMALAGASWGIYSLRGRSSGAAPLATNAANFLRTLPPALLLAGGVTAYGRSYASTSGTLLAVASGALASGLGYSLWYAALRQLMATRAAVVQLLVPILAAGGGVLLLGEPVSLRLVLSGAAVLGGVALAMLGPRTGPRPSRQARA